MFRQGLARVLEKEPGFAVVGQCASAAAAIRELPGCGATMILLDVDLGAERAIDFIASMPIPVHQVRCWGPALR